ncbi:hypothetical protein JD844_005127 [Phrynosoma platyrhinos]|uniref:LIM zinc-binding domain-containing protein n=1 Tax=Phrynosoma platyrhinos TaxID=52577 RepID=A0ABQ7TNR1_PHRPL|nr:hypothetical protein JD844_005127 [Phrynosoma platyrhinos]
MMRRAGLSSSSLTREAARMTEGFDCAGCKESLYGRKYIQGEEGPFCIPCYDTHFANTCDECKEPIGHDCRELYYEERHYHEGCFRCFRCGRSLAEEPFTCQGEELLCNDCYCQEFSSQCVACQQVVMPGSRKLEYSGQTWHEHCFLCSSCQQPIGSRSFIPDQKDYYCVPCYESKFAPRCTRCKKSLTKGGVTYRDEPWHKECFVCTGCRSPLAGQQFTSQEEQPFCLTCFASLYAKKCSACAKPITGEQQKRGGLRVPVGTEGQASVGASMSPLKSGTGTTTASAAPAVPPPWWGRVSSLGMRRFCAVTVPAACERCPLGCSMCQSPPSGAAGHRGPTLPIP